MMRALSRSGACRASPLFAKLGSTVMTSRETISMSASKVIARLALPVCLGCALAAPAQAQQAEPPTVVRGIPATPPAAKAVQRDASMPFAAGRYLWVVDREGDELIGCKLMNTTEVGEIMIRCVDRRLPRQFQN
jgi:hypothetical protein